MNLARERLFCIEVYKTLNSFPANIRLGEDVLKTYWRRLQDVFSVTFFCLPRRLEDVLKTSGRRLGKREMFAGVNPCFMQ